MKEEIPNEVEFRDRESAVTYGRKLKEFGYETGIIRKGESWVVKYKKRRNRYILL